MNLGTKIIEAVVRSGAIEKAIVLENGNQIFVWRSNASEQIEAALEEINNEQTPTPMTDPQNEPRTCPYCDQPREDTFPNRIRFRCGSATRQPGHVTPKQSEECQLRVDLRAAQAEARELEELIGLASTSFSMLEAYLGPQWFEAVSNMELVGPDKVHARAALAKHKEAQP